MEWTRRSSMLFLLIQSSAQGGFLSAARDKLVITSSSNLLPCKDCVYTCSRVPKNMCRVCNTLHDLRMTGSGSRDSSLEPQKHFSIIQGHVHVHTHTHTHRGHVQRRCSTLFHHAGCSVLVHHFLSVDPSLPLSWTHTSSVDYY